MTFYRRARMRISDWMIIGTRIEKFSHVVAGLFFLCLIIPVVTLLFWVSGADLTQRGPALALYLTVCLYVLFLVVKIGVEKYNRDVFLKAFK